MSKPTLKTCPTATLAFWVLVAELAYRHGWRPKKRNRRASATTTGKTRRGNRV